MGKEKSKEKDKYLFFLNVFAYCQIVCLALWNIFMKAHTCIYCKDTKCSYYIQAIALEGFHKISHMH